jgi:hypothetical protein
MLREALGMLGPTWPGGLAGVIPCPILEEQQVLRGVGQEGAPARLGTLRGQPALAALIEPTARDLRQGAQDLLAFSCATGCDLGRRAAAGPRGTERPPLGQTGLILKAAQAVLPLGGPPAWRPGLREPGWTPGGVEMVRHPAGLVKREAPLGPPRTPLLAGVEHAALPPEQHPEEHGGPTGGLAAHARWPGLQQRHQAFCLAWGQLRWAPTARVIDPAVQPSPEAIPGALGRGRRCGGPSASAGLRQEEHSVILTPFEVAVDGVHIPERRYRDTWRSEVPTAHCRCTRTTMPQSA